jgi:maleylacetoacetate isomerase
MSDAQLTLYSYFRSSASARVRTIMNLHSIPHDTKYIHLLKGEQKSAEYTALNAGQSVPTLIVREAGGEWALAQSTAIMEYLDEVYGPGSKAGVLLPKEPKARAQIRSIIALLCGDLFPMLSMRTLNRVKAAGGQAEPWANECSMEYITGESRQEGADGSARGAP